MKKIALVTGASRGIGAAIATKLAKEGYSLHLICHHNIDKLNSLASELRSEYSVDVTTYQGDVSDSSFIDSVMNGLDSLDLLINNAGISYVGLLQDMSDEEWHKVLSTNLDSAFYTSRRAIKLMLSEHKGHIINISSMWGTVGASMEVAYSASKGGMNTFTKALAKELAPSGISVNAIACGVIDTDMNRIFSDEEREALASEIPAGRFAAPEEVADLVALIAKSPAYMTGQIIGFDGGYI